MSVLTLLVQPNSFGAHSFKALQDVVRDALPPPTVALERPQNHQSNLKPEESREHVLASPRTKKSLDYVLACPQPESPLHTVFVSPQPLEPSDHVLASRPTEESLKTFFWSRL